LLLTNDINPAKLKALPLAEKRALCEEIRRLLIAVVSKNGGHLASNLGTVELITAMHSVFTTPRDSFVFDVGHQAYTHKLLTGRLTEFSKVRQEGGISGFPRMAESEHDAFIGGHASIAVSAGLGIAAAKSLNNDSGKVVAVAGDGSFTGGGIYEGLNNAGRGGIGKNLIVVLNDNGMSISKSSGALASYLTQIRTKSYYEAKSRVKKILSRTTLGKGVSGAIGETKKFVKGALIPENLFENLGFKYFGPVDGHNLEELIFIFEHVKTINSPCLIHVKTKKGKGYMPAEENAGHYHGIDKNKQNTKKAEIYSDVFGREITHLGAKDTRICLITAAMKYATGCNYFAKKFPERFFDAGIAEAHAATFAAGLAAAGKLPVFAVYSTFMQRAFDQLLHDTAIEKLRMVLAIDRAGLSGEDGATHQGTFDVGLLSLIPGTAIYAPLTAAELRLCLNKALYEDSGIAAVRYPRGVAFNPANEEPRTDYFIYKGGYEHRTLIITYGRPIKPALKLLKHGADVLRLVRLNPLPAEVFEIAGGYENIVFFEEGAACIAQKFSSFVPDMKVRAIDGFVPIADVERQMQLCGFDEQSMREFAGLQGF
jgi:1-deoxy-D-xylulose-5-phosphate synthase